ncbi:hypothetical protein THFILI_01925 [Thermus filiformis]|uniref:Lipoprotein n=1 Tax=Thermus filiformis TaxID=276 RepID=A0A0D6XBN8_THEFI|nr:hypothetical protein THFILI_01925 [Thermus filiformis]
MKKLWTLVLAGLLGGLLAGCGGGGTGPSPLSQLSQAETETENQGQALLSEAVSAFSDLIPQALSPQATGEVPPITLASSGEETVLIGGPWRPPFPFPLPPVDKPLFITIKGKPPRAHLAYLRQDPAGRYFLEWYGERGVAPVRVPATLTTTGQAPSDRQKVKHKWSFQFIPPKIDLIFYTEDPVDPFALHIVSEPPPSTLPGRPLQSTPTYTLPGRFKVVCCGWPKPWPTLDIPPIWLIRQDVSVVGLPYDNPRVKNATTIEELVGQDLGFLYIRRKLPGGTTTDCGLNRVWCPPDTDPFLNLRLVRQGEGYAIQFTKLSDPKQVIATLPAQVSLNGDQSFIGIEDDLNSPEEPTLKIKWPKITIEIKIVIR